jgi:hypothetical protein
VGDIVSRYAVNTEVSVEKSRGEIERILSRYGATAFMYGWDEAKAVVQFRASDRLIRFLLPLPDRDDRAFTHTPSKGLRRSSDDAERAWEQACRVQWRSLALVIKAKLEAVEAGITEFEDEFLAHVVLPDGSTVGAFIRPQIADAYSSGLMPSALPALGPGS